MITLVSRPREDYLQGRKYIWGKIYYLQAFCHFPLIFFKNFIYRACLKILTKTDFMKRHDFFKNGFFPIEIQYLTTALERILFSLVVMVLAFGERGPWFESCLDHIFVPCIYSFVSLLNTVFLRCDFQHLSYIAVESASIHPICKFFYQYLTQFSYWLLKC